MIIDLNKLNRIHTIILEKSSTKNDISTQNTSRREGVVEAEFRREGSSDVEKSASKEKNSITGLSDEYFKNILAEYLNSPDLNTQTNREEVEIADYRLIRLDNLSLVKRKDAYVYELIREKVIGYNSVRQLKTETHKKMKELSMIDLFFRVLSLGRLLISGSFRLGRSVNR